MSIPQNIFRVRDQIISAARKVGRDPAGITLMAVTKKVSPENIRTAYEAGLRVFGESRIQEFSGKRDSVQHLEDAEWHMIGQLQSNKAAKAAQLFSGIDSIGSLRLAEKLNTAAQSLAKKITVLIEINVGGEAVKGGLPPDSPELEVLLQSAPTFEHLSFRGLMTVPPFAEDAERTRIYFRRMRELRDQISRRLLPAVNMDILSTGMSHDFEVAIQEGSTCVRIGTAIFGSRLAG